MKQIKGKGDEQFLSEEQVTPPWKPGDGWKLIALIAAPFAVMCIAALAGGRIAGLW